MESSWINDVLIPTHDVCCVIKSNDAMFINAAFVKQDAIWTWLFMTCGQRERLRHFGPALRVYALLDAQQEMCFKFLEKILK